MGFTRNATDLISKRIAKITKCGITPINSEFSSSGCWVSAFGQCVIFQNSPPEKHRHLALQFVRHVETAFEEYLRAHNSLKDLLGNGGGRWSPYFNALNHLEATISHLYMAYDVARKELGKEYYQKNDGSDYDRLNKLFNASKHQVASSEQVLWITNKGVSTDKTSITFIEIECMLRSYGKLANRITNQDT